MKAQSKIDPEEIFGICERTINLATTFPKSQFSHRKCFTKRRATGNWRFDGVNKREEKFYKKQMGFVPNLSAIMSRQASASGQAAAKL